MSLSKKGRFGTSPGTSLSFQIIPQKGYVPLALLDPEKLAVTDSTGKILPGLHLHLFHFLNPSGTENLAEDYTVSIKVSSDSLPDMRTTCLSLKGNLPVLVANEKRTLPAQLVTLDGNAVSIPVPGSEGANEKEKNLTVTATTHRGLHENGSIYWNIRIMTPSQILFHSLSLKNKQGKELTARLYDQPSYFYPEDNRQREINLFYAIPEHEKTIMIQIAYLVGNQTMYIPMKESIGLGGALNNTSLKYSK